MYRTFSLQIHMPVYYRSHFPFFPLLLCRSSPLYEHMSSEWSNRQSKAHYLLKERRSRRKFQEETTKAELSPTAIVEEVDPPFRSESKVASRIDLAPIQQIQSPLKVLVASAPKAEVPRSPDRYRESSSAYQTHQESAITFTTNDLESPSRRQQSPARTCQSLHQLNSPEENQDSLCSPNQFSLQRSRSRQVQQCDQIQSSVVMEERQLIILISVGVSDRNQATHQDRSLTIMKGKGTPFEVVDGMDPNQKKRRNQLFEISGIRG